MPRQATLKLEPDLISEEGEQAELMFWASRHEHEYPGLELLFHVPNGGSRTAVYLPSAGGSSRRVSLEGLRLKRLGVKPGVPDLFLPVPGRSLRPLDIEGITVGGLGLPVGNSYIGIQQTHPGLFIELKRLRDFNVSEDQRHWHQRLRAQGYRVEVCAGCEAAKKVLMDYLSTV